MCFLSHGLGQNGADCTFSSVRHGMHCDHVARLCFCTYIFNFGELFNEKQSLGLLRKNSLFSFQCNIFSSSYIIPATLLSKHIKFPAVLGAAREESLGTKGPVAISPHTSLVCRFSQKKPPQESFRPPTPKVSGTRGMTKRRGVILASFLCHRTGAEVAGCRTQKEG